MTDTIPKEAESLPNGTNDGQKQLADTDPSPSSSSTADNTTADNSASASSASSSAQNPVVGGKPSARKRARQDGLLFDLSAIQFDDSSDSDDKKPAEGYSRYGARRRTQTVRLDDELAAARAAEQTAAKQKKQAAAKAKKQGRRNNEDEDNDEGFEEANDDDDDEDYDEGRKSSRRGRKGRASTRTEVTDAEPRYFFTRRNRTISYAEDSDSDEFLDEEEREIVKEERRRQKSQQQEELDGNVIERILDHRSVLPADAKGEDERPKLSDDPQSIDWEHGVEYYIKWRGWAAIHNTWETYDNLKPYLGFKRVDIYIQKVKDIIAWRKTASLEDIEQADIQREMEKRVQEEARKVERVVAMRKVPKSEDFPHEVAYYVKWCGQPYSECTWEDPDDISEYQSEIDKMLERKACSYIPRKTTADKPFTELRVQPEGLVGGKLRDYQLASVNLMTRWFTENINGILADEMGLGKTIQTIALLHNLKQHYGVNGPHIIVVPLSTVSNWVNEFNVWSPHMNVLVYGGNSESRRIIRDQEFYGEKGRIKFNVLLTTREMILKDRNFLSSINWRYLIVDEAQCLKNYEAQLYLALMEFKTTNKLLITGTPLQNNIGELWSLIHFLMPQKFASLEEFENRYSDLQQNDQIMQLHSEIKPYLLRRVKKDVEKSLPQKYEQILRVPASPMQKKYCEWVIQKNFRELNRGASGQKSTLLNVVVELKKVFNHPYLFPGAEDPEEKNVLGALIGHSGKMRLLDKLLVRLKETGHRVLIFSQMVRMLDILSDYLRMKGWQFQRLDGSTPHEMRKNAMDHFNAEDSPDFVFLLSTHAGGLGVNLASADTVIIYDSDWNPQNDLQAQSRCHRIGQNKTVNIYRLVVSDSVEETIIERAKQKMVLDHLVIQSMDTTAASLLDKPADQNATSWLMSGMGNSSSEYSKEELQAIIRFRAESLFKKEDEQTAGGEGGDDLDIDAILARAENVDRNETTSRAEQLLNSFNVTSIAAPSDEEYWSKVLPEDSAKNAAELDATMRARNDAVKTVPLKETESRKRQQNTSSSSARPGSKMKRGAWEDKEIKSFIRGFRMFPDLSRIDNIISTSPHVLGQRKPQKLVELGEELVAACKDAKEHPEKLTVKEEPQKTEGSGEGEEKKSNVSKTATLSFHNIPVDPLDILHRMECAQLLAEKVKQYGDVALTFRVVDVMKPPAWSIPWGPKEDSMLLLGVYRHGIGNWEAITTDESLGLEAVHETKIKAAQLMRRVEALFRSLSDPSSNSGDQQAKPKSVKKSTPKRKPSAQKRPSPGDDDKAESKDDKEEAKKSEPKKKSSKKEKNSELTSSPAPAPATKDKDKDSEEKDSHHHHHSHHSKSGEEASPGKPVPKKPRSADDKDKNVKKEKEVFTPPKSVDPVYGAWNMFAPLTEDMWIGSESPEVRAVLRRRRSECDDIMGPVATELQKMAYFRNHTVDKGVDFVVKKSMKYLCTVGDHICKVLAGYSFHNVELKQCLWAYASRHTKCCGPALLKMYNKICDGDCPSSLARSKL